jgi:hypothetical protein
MVDDVSPWVPLWTVHVTLASALLAVPSYLVGSRYADSATAVTAVGVTYVLYKWGQYRDPPSKYSDDDDKKRKEMEMEAEAGGYGGNM